MSSGTASAKGRVETTGNRSAVSAPNSLDPKGYVLISELYVTEGREDHGKSKAKGNQEDFASKPDADITVGSSRRTSCRTWDRPSLIVRPHSFCQTVSSSAESATSPYGTRASKSAGVGDSEALHV